MPPTPNWNLNFEIYNLKFEIWNVNFEIRNASSEIWIWNLRIEIFDVWGLRFVTRDWRFEIWTIALRKTHSYNIINWASRLELRLEIWNVRFLRLEICCIRLEIWLWCAKTFEINILGGLFGGWDFEMGRSEIEIELWNLIGGLKFDVWDSWSCRSIAWTWKFDIVRCKNIWN